MTRRSQEPLSEFVLVADVDRLNSFGTFGDSFARWMNVGRFSLFANKLVPFCITPSAI